MSERTLSVLDGSTFVVGNRHGDDRSDGWREQGFFCADTRFLSNGRHASCARAFAASSIGHVELDMRRGSGEPVGR